MLKRILILIAWSLIMGLYSPSAWAKLPSEWSRFSRSVGVSWEANRQKLPFEVSSWVIRFFNHDAENVAHLWPTVQMQLPRNFESTAQAIYLYSLWELKVPQTFLQQWLRFLENKSFRDSAYEMELEKVLAPKIRAWLVDTVPTVPLESVGLVSFLAKLQRKPFLELAYWASLRQSDGAQWLSLMDKTHPLRPWLVGGLIYQKARGQEVDEALQLLENEKESLERARSSGFSLMMAGRLHYQKGNLSQSDQLFRKVKPESSYFKEAREELLWIWLRQGNSALLRGELVSLLATEKDPWAKADLLYLSAVSNLKLCYFDETERDMKQFNQLVRPLLSQATMKFEKGAPFTKPDLYSKIAKRRISQRSQELNKLDLLELSSVEGPIPSVGYQANWSRFRKMIRSEWQLAKREYLRENSRQWSYRKIQLENSVRRMNFLQAEWREQVTRFSENEEKLRTENIGKTAERFEAHARAKKEEVLQSETDKLNFPVDSVRWEDELFSIRSVARNHCLKLLENENG